MFTVITPYIFENEIKNIQRLAPWQLDWIFEEDIGRIGPDMMYQKMWNECDEDIFIFHSDMEPVSGHEIWWDKVQHYADSYPEAGILGCKLLYPLCNENQKYYIECAGGKFENNKPDHYGSGIEIGSRVTFKTPEVDEGQYDYVREVAWYTFGGIFIRRQVLNEVGSFDATFEWSYNRDVDFCLRTRELGWKIYQIPVPLFHYQSKDIKRIKTEENANAEARNLIRLQNKWQNSPFYQTIGKRIEKETESQKLQDELEPIIND